MKAVAIIAYTFFLIVTGAGVSVQAKQKGPQAVIFMYHRFGESSHPSTNVTLKQFDEQLWGKAGFTC